MHDVEHVLLLLKLVLHLETVACHLLHARLDGLEVGPGTEFELKTAHAAGLLEEGLGKGEGGDEVVVVVLALVDVEADAGGGDVEGVDALAGVGQIDALALAGGAYLECAVVDAAHGGGQTNAGYAVLYGAAVELVGACAVEYGAYAGDVVVVVVDALEGDDGGTAAEEYEGVVLEAV